MPDTIPAKPTLCKDYRFSDTGALIAEAKVDGVRCVLRVSDGIQAYTRNGYMLDIGRDAEIAAKALGHEVIDCELRDGVIHIFDLPAFGGSWRVRRAALEHAYARVAGMPGIALVPVLHDPAKDNGYPEPVATLMQTALNMGYEGLVLKDPGEDYRQDSRTWHKVKTSATEDLRVVGILGNGSLVVNRRGVKVTVGMGLSKAMRSDSASMLGRLIEVRFQEVTASGSMRHPVLVRVRDDKDESN